jgi:hypothetical protein
MRWVGNVVCKGEIRNTYKIVVSKPEGRDHFEDVGVDGRVILQWIFI